MLYSNAYFFLFLLVKYISDYKSRLKPSLKDFSTVTYLQALTLRVGVIIIIFLNYILENVVKNIMKNNIFENLWLNVSVNNLSTQAPMH